MAEGEATVRGTSDVGEGTGTRMVGGSLPPRKRLLAGLKQNGLWLASSSPTAASTFSAVHGPDGGVGTLSALRSNSDGLTEETKGGCMGCGVRESDVWRKAKHNGVVHRLCDFCSLSFSKNLNCPRCLGVYPDVKDPAVWLECCRCQRYVHVECEQRGREEDLYPYLCPECVHPKKDEERANSLLGTVAPTGRLCLNSDAEAENSELPSSAECSSLCNKKPRVSRDPRSRSSDVDEDGAGKSDEIFNNTKVLLGRKGSNSKEAAAAAAAAAAALAGKAAAAAKASAAAKAATAVKAAATAKAALDAAALAARVEAQGRIELRKNYFAWEYTAVGDVKFDAALFQLRKERPEGPEVKNEAEVKTVATHVSSIDDEELARQLHRAINSSPRISSGLTPSRKKPTAKLAANVSGAHAVTSWPRPGLSPESDPRSAAKQQQTRPRSLHLKEVKRVESRDPKIESKPSGGNSRTRFPQQEGAIASTKVIALKSEPAGSSTVILGRQDSGNVLLHDATSAQLNVLSEDDHMNGASVVLSGLEDRHKRRLSGPDVSQAAALLDEVLMSEADADKSSKEENSCSLHNRTGIRIQGDLDGSTTMTFEEDVSGTHVRFPKEEGLDSTPGAGMVNTNMSGVSALVEVASSAMEFLENQDTSAGTTSVDGPWLPGGGDDNSKAGISAEKLGEVSGKDPCTIPVVSSKSASDSERSSGQSLPQLAAARMEWEQATLHEGSGEVFSSGVHIGAFSPKVPIRPPSLSGRATVRHC